MRDGTLGVTRGLARESISQIQRIVASKRLLPDLDQDGARLAPTAEGGGARVEKRETWGEEASCSGHELRRTGVGRSTVVVAGARADASHLRGVAEVGVVPVRLGARVATTGRRIAKVGAAAVKIRPWEATLVKQLAWS
jgi:hypothetical protein